MTTITWDEREAREWLESKADDEIRAQGRHARLIMRLLDAPRMPAPVDVSDAVMVKIADENHIPYANFRAMYRALYDHYTAPPQPKGPWAIKAPDGSYEGVFIQRSDAERYLQRASGSRIVKLTEDR